MKWNFFKSWSAADLKEQEQRTQRKIEALKRMLVDNPANIFLQSQLNSELEKHKEIVNNLKKN